jgi:hypothetical protein
MRLPLILSLLLACIMLQGCSISRVFSGPDPISFEKVKTGESRNTIISALGIPKSTETKPDCRVDVYEFVDGFSGASKTRCILYIAGDFFTIGIAEIIFWPIELAIGQGTAGRAVVTYGMDDIAQNILLTKTDGSPWVVPKPEAATPVQ